MRSKNPSNCLHRFLTGHLRNDLVHRENAGFSREALEQCVCSIILMLLFSIITGATSAMLNGVLCL